MAQFFNYLLIFSFLFLCLGFSTFGYDFLFNFSITSKHIQLFLALFIAFYLHIISHKLLANKFNSSIRILSDLDLLFLSLFLSIAFRIFFPFLGAVFLVSKNWLSLEKHGLIALAGPFSNMLMAFFILLIPLINQTIFTNNLDFFSSLFFINLSFSFFTLLPFFPFDGHRIFIWKRELWSLLLSLSVMLFFLGFSIFNNFVW